MIYRFALIAVALSPLVGCGGGYILTAPDTPALAGGVAPVVVRLQMREFWVYWPPVDRAPLTFRQVGQPLRCARTDKKGYAAVVLPAPHEAGRAEVTIHLQDALGDTADGSTSIYALPADRPIIVVDMDSLPAEKAEVAAAADVLTKAAATTGIIYLSERLGASPSLAHRLLKEMGCPDGPVVPWKPAGRRFRLPWHKRGPGMLAGLKDRMPKLWAGISADPVAGRRFRQAGLKVLLVGSIPVEEGAEQFDSWPKVILSAPSD